jgi:tetratricopeptide (TPR) repeat protein
MGVVYLALDPVLEREVAIKMLTSGNLQGDQRERFEREARAVAKLDHPGIVPIYDFADYEGNLFFVMPFVEGKTLRAVQKDETLKPYEVLEIGAQVAEALNYSHQRGIVHRDIKPENIMVTKEGEDWRAKLMDFGIALGPKDSRMTKSDIIVGTLAYLPPESILDSSSSPAADIYSLGVVLFEALSGKLPFSGDTQTVLYKIVHSEPEPPGLLASLVDIETENIILSCMAKAAPARPKDGSEIGGVLRELARRLRNPDVQLSNAIVVPRAGSAIVGRAHEIEDLVKSFHRAQAGEAQLALIGGETGFGKASLLRELERMAKSRGALVLHGRFVERMDPALPYQGFGEAFREYLDADPAEATTVLGDLLPELRILFPEIAEAVRSESQPVKLGRREDRTFTLDLLARTVGRLAASKPLVLLFEDLHLADASIEAIQYVFHRRSSSRLMIASTYVLAGGGDGDPLSRLVKSLRGDQGTLLIQLKALEADDCRELAAGILGKDRVPEDSGPPLLQATGGNPFFVAELVRSLAPDGRFEEFLSAARRGAVQGLALPSSLQKFMEEKVAALSAPDRSVLQAAAVIGASFDPAELIELSGLGASAESVIEGLMERGVFRDDSVSGGSRLTFASTLLLDATYRTLNQVRRRALHRSYAEFLETRYAKRLDRVAPVLCRHFSIAGLLDRAAHHGLAAARSAFAGGAYEESRRLAQTVLTLVESEDWLGDQNVEADICLVYARAALEAFESEDAGRMGRRAATLFARGQDYVKQSEALILAADAALRALKLDEAKALATEGLELAREHRLSGPVSRFTEILEAVQQSRSQGSAAAAVITTRHPTPQISAAQLRPQAAPRPTALLLLEAEYLAAEEATEERARRSDPASAEEEVAHLMRFADLALKIGRLGPGLDACRHALKLATAGDVVTMASLGLLHTRLLLRTLQLDEALEAARTAAAPNFIMKGAIPRALAVQIAAHEAEALVLLGEPGKARERLEGEGLDGEGGEEDRSMPLFLAYAEVLAHLGDRSLAFDRVNEALSTAESRGDSLAVVQALDARARMLLLAGTPDAAIEDVRKALSLVAEVPDALLLTSVRLSLGRCLADLGAVSAADAEFLAANREAERLGARVLLLEAQLGLSETNRVRGRYLAAEIAARVSLQFATAASAKLLQSRAEFALAQVFRDSGAAKEAIHSLERARSIARDAGEVSVHIDSLTELARLARQNGEIAHARDLALEAWNESTEHGDLVRRGATMLELGRLEIQGGQIDAAVTRFRGALAAAVGSGAPRLATRLYSGLVDSQLKANDIHGALRYAEAAEASTAGLGEFGASEQIQTAFLTARIQRIAQNLPGLREAVTRAMKLADQNGDRLLQALSAREAGGLCIEVDPDLALAILEKGLLRAREADALAIEAAISGHIASIQIRQGSVLEARRNSEAEMDTMGRAGMVKGSLRNRLRLARCLELLGELKECADMLESEAPPVEDPPSAVGLLSYRSQIKLSQGRLRGSIEDAEAAVRLATRGPGRYLADALLQRVGYHLATADATAVVSDLEGAKRASESAEGVHRPFEDALLAYFQGMVLVLKGDPSKGVAPAEAAGLIFERGSHEIFASQARLLAARCLARTDSASSDRLAARVEAFARERSLLPLHVQALTLRGLLAHDLLKLDEAAQLASRIGSPWILAGIAHVRQRIFTRRKDEKASALENKAFLSHMSIVSSEMDAETRARMLAAAQKGEHPYVL